MSSNFLSSVLLHEVVDERMNRFANQSKRMRSLRNGGWRKFSNEKKISWQKEVFHFIVFPFISAYLVPHRHRPSSLDYSKARVSLCLWLLPLEIHHCLLLFYFSFYSHFFFVHLMLGLAFVVCCAVKLHHILSSSLLTF